MKFSSKLIVLGLYSAYLAGCSAGDPTTSSIKQDFSTGCSSNSASAQTVMSAVNAKDCAAATQNLQTATSIKTDKPVDLEMLQSASALTELETYLDANTTSLDRLAGLAKLEALSIFDSSLTSLKGIEGLPKLTWIAITSSKLQKIDVASTSATALWIDADSLENIDALSQYTNLESVHIFTSKTLNLAPLANLTKLKSVWIRSAGALDLSPLQGLKNLKDLMVYNDNLTSIDALNSVPALDSLTIKSSGLASIEGLSGRAFASKLTALQLVGTRVTDLTEAGKIPTLKGLATVDGIAVKIPFKSLKGLENLNVSGSQLELADSDLTGFSNLSTLFVDASNFPVAQLDAPKLSFLSSNQTARKGSDFANFSKLEILTADNASLTNVAGLAEKPELMFLSVPNNKIQSFPELAKSQKLNYLDISNNTIPDRFTLPSINGLETIIAHHNAFETLTPFKRQLNLFELDVSYTNANADTIDNLFTTNQGEDRSLWLSLVHCDGIKYNGQELNSQFRDCSKTFSVPSGETVRIFQYEANNHSASLTSEMNHLKTLAKLDVQINAVDSTACIWTKNHLQQLETLESAVTLSSEDLKTIGWANPNFNDLVTNLCGENGCSSDELNAHYQIDIQQCFGGPINENTKKRLSLVVKTQDQITDPTVSLALDYLSSDAPSGPFLSYLSDMEIKLKGWSENAANALTALAAAKEGARIALLASQSKAQAFLDKIARIEKVLGERVQIERAELVKAISDSKDEIKK